MTTQGGWIVEKPRSQEAKKPKYLTLSPLLFFHSLHPKGDTVCVTESEDYYLTKVALKVATLSQSRMPSHNNKAKRR